jgi:hypothetical protein
VTLVALFLPSVTGGGRAVLASERPAERADVERAALARGVPITWPQVAINAEQARSRADSAAAVLVGMGSADSMSWTFSHAGQTAQGQGGLQAGVNLAADALAARYAPASTRTLATESVSIGGIDGIRAYAGVVEYLQSLSLVRAVNVEEVAGATVRFRLALRGDVELLRRVAALDTHLQPGARGAPPEGGEGTDFTWQP